MTRPYPLLLGALALASVGLVGTVVFQRVEIRRLRALLARPAAASRPNFAGGGARPGDATLTRTAAQALTRPTASTRPEPTEPRDDEFVPPPPLLSTAARPRPSGLSRLMADPEFVRAFALHQEGALDARFAALFRQLHLSAEELANFKRLLVEKDSVALDVVAISQETPSGPLPVGELRASISAAQSQVENAIQASLGSERYAVYREFERTLAQRAVVARLEQRLSYTPTPLQPDQAEALVQLLAQGASAEAPPARPALAVLPASGSREEPPIVHAGPAAMAIAEETLARSNAVLTPPQVAALRQIQGEILATAAAARFFNAFIPPSGRREDEILRALRTLMQ